MLTQGIGLDALPPRLLPVRSISAVTVPFIVVFPLLTWDMNQARSSASVSW